jgi:hypothetical protein
MNSNESPGPRTTDSHAALAIAYISLNEVDLLLSVVGECNKIGQEVHVFMDSRTEELEFIKLENAHVEYSVVKNEYEIPEGIHEIVCNEIGTEWVWNLNGDEIPSPESLASAHALVKVAPPQIQCIGFPRRWLRRTEKGDAEVSRARFMGLDYQWRIIRTKNVTFKPVVHTPGFVVDHRFALKMPPAAVVYHLDWIAHSFELRQRKVNRYESIAPGAAKYFTKWYLPELNERKHRFKKVDDKLVIEFVEAVHKKASSTGWVDKV